MSAAGSSSTVSSTSRSSTAGSTSSSSTAASTLWPLQLQLAKFHSQVVGALVQRCLSHPCDHVLLEGLLVTEPAISEHQVGGIAKMRLRLLEY
jgi:hypothetical protein